MHTDIKIIIEKYIVWTLCNIGFSILPIGIIWIVGLINSNADYVVIFSSILALTYTILVVSIYNYMPFPLQKRESIFEELLIFGSFFMSSILLIMYVLYNTLPKLQEFMQNHASLWFLLLLVLIIVILLNTPSIQNRISDKKAAAIGRALEKGEQKRGKWMSNLASGGGK